MESQVQVGIVLRPLVDSEIIDGAKGVVDIDGKRIAFSSIAPSTANYEFDWAFNNSRIIYSSMISPLIKSIFQGFTATVMAYGQTGSGKTYVMGSSVIDKNETSASTSSIIPSSINDIFLKKSQCEANGSIVSLEMSYLEIYKEECYDLLASLLIQQRNEDKENQATPKNKKETEKSRSIIEMRENSKGETLLEGLSSWPVENQAEVNRLLAIAAKARVTGKTAMNARSSRSHAIATFSLRIRTTENQYSR
jgi:kinesin family protein 4/21/27